METTNVMTSSENSRKLLSVKELLKSMKTLRKLYPDNLIKGYLVRSRKGTVMSNVIRLKDLTNKFNYLHNDEYRKTCPIYSNQTFEVIEIINKNNMSIEASYASPDDENFYLRKDGRLKQFTDSHNLIILAKMTL